MSFINVSILERIEGTPGVVEDQQHSIIINTDNIILFNGGKAKTKSKNLTFVRITCGTTITVAMPYDKFVNKLLSAGVDVEEVEEVEKVATKKKKKKKKNQQKRKEDQDQ